MGCPQCHKHISWATIQVRRDMLDIEQRGSVLPQSVPFAESTTLLDHVHPIFVTTHTSCWHLQHPLMCPCCDIVQNCSSSSPAKICLMGSKRAFLQVVYLSAAAQEHHAASGQHWRAAVGVLRIGAEIQYLKCRPAQHYCWRLCQYLCCICYQPHRSNMWPSCHPELPLG